MVGPLRAKRVFQSFCVAKFNKMSYVIKIENKKVFDYYNNNKNVNFEEMSVLMVDILLKICKKNDCSLDSTLAEKILGNMINLNSKIENMDMVFENKFTDFQKSYTQELNIILNNNTNERVTGVLKEYNESLHDKTKIFFNDFFPKNNEAIALQLNNSFNITTQLINSTESRLALQINENNIKLNDIGIISNTQNNIANNLNLLINKFHGSSTKGNFSEISLVEGLMKIYPYGNVEHVGNKLNNSGDIFINRKDKIKIIIENKEYTNVIPPTEIQKFVDNVILNNCDGIMVSQHTQIKFKDDFEINFNGDLILIYICNMEYNIDKIRTAISIIDHLRNQIGFINKDKTNISFTLEEIDLINKEYIFMVNQKKIIIKSLTDSFNKITKEVENIKIPFLEDILLKQYGVKLSEEEKCKDCNKACKNYAGVSAHLKWCNEYKKTENYKEDVKKKDKKKEKVLNLT